MKFLFYYVLFYEEVYMCASKLRVYFSSAQPKKKPRSSIKQKEEI
jgi:hypothetical protein